MSCFSIYMTLSILISGSLAAVPAVVRCFTLLIGLLAILPKSVEDDRSQIFREFARAVSLNHAVWRRRVSAVHGPDTAVVDRYRGSSA